MSKNTNNEQNKINFKKSRSIVNFLGLEEKNSNTVFFFTYILFSIVILVHYEFFLKDITRSVEHPS